MTGDFSALTALIFFGACLLVGMTIVIVGRFFLRWRVAVADGGKGASIPLHVWTVALSYDLFVLGMVIRVYEDGADWQKAALYIPALLFGLFGMAVLARKQQKR